MQVCMRGVWSGGILDRVCVGGESEAVLRCIHGDPVLCGGELGLNVEDSL